MVHTYGTNMQQSAWQLFSLSFFFFLNQLPWKQCKTGGSGEDTGFP